MSDEVILVFKWRKFCEECEYKNECDKDPWKSFKCFVGEEIAYRDLEAYIRRYVELKEEIEDYDKMEEASDLFGEPGMPEAIEEDSPPYVELGTGIEEVE